MAKTKIMGVLNITPDSFSDGGNYFSFAHAISHARELVAAGADIIDIGGESSRPGAQEVSSSEELSRVLPVIKQLHKELTIPLSIDTRKPEVADACLAAGASILNDITGFTDETMFSVAKKYDATIVIMHMQGLPQTMQKDPSYADVVQEIKEFLRAQAEKAKQHGIREIVIDPGIGFGKTLAHNVAIFQNVQEFVSLGYPVLIGASRKSFIEKIIPGLAVDKRLSATIAANTVAIMNGAAILRVHDVKECVQAAKIADALKQEQ